MKDGSFQDFLCVRSGGKKGCSSASQQGSKKQTISSHGRMFYKTRISFFIEVMNQIKQHLSLETVAPNADFPPPVQGDILAEVIIEIKKR